MDAFDYLTQMNAGQISCFALVQHVLEAISNREPRVHAYISIRDAEEILA